MPSKSFSCFYNFLSQPLPRNHTVAVLEIMKKINDTKTSLHTNWKDKKKVSLDKKEIANILNCKYTVYSGPALYSIILLLNVIGHKLHQPAEITLSQEHQYFHFNKKIFCSMARAKSFVGSAVYCSKYFS